MLRDLLQELVLQVFVEGLVHALVQEAVTLGDPLQIIRNVFFLYVGFISKVALEFFQQAYNSHID
jgi:hypothetical protein